jgi:hypothetical protein
LDALDYQVITHCFNTEFDLYGWRREKEKEKLQHWRSYPVIIFDGSLWGLTLTDEEFDIAPIEYAVLEFTHHNQGYFVDVVQWNAIDTFIDRIQKEVNRLNKIRS